MSLNSSTSRIIKQIEAFQLSYPHSFVLSFVFKIQQMLEILLQALFLINLLDTARAVNPLGAESLAGSLNAC